MYITPFPTKVNVSPRYLPSAGQSLQQSLCRAQGFLLRLLCFSRRLKIDVHSLWLPGGVRSRAAQVADAVRQSASNASEAAELLRNREVVRDSQKRIRKGFLEAWDQLRQTRSLGAHGFLALPAEGTTLALCLLTS